MKKYLDYIPIPLLKDIIENRCVPIIGAGFSRNAELPREFQMPDWNNLGQYFASQIKGYPYRNSIDAISAFCHEFGRPVVVEQLRKVLHTDKVQPGETHLNFAKLPFDIVITTNFDFLLEKSYERTKRMCYPILEDDQLSTTILHDKQISTSLLKIHGDLNHPTRLILTEEDYDTYIDNYPLMCTYIANLLISRTPLLIGYSLDDPDFRGLWQIIGSRLGKLRRTGYRLSTGINDVERARFERRGIKTIFVGS
jgi:hypothetical protein